VLLGVLFASFVLEFSVVVDFMHKDKWAAGSFLVWLILPFQVFCGIMLERQIGGVMVRVVTNFRIMECVFKKSHVSCKTMTYPCISGTYASSNSLEFIIENTPLLVKKHGKPPKRIVFEHIPDVHELEQSIQRNRFVRIQNTSPKIPELPELYASEKEIPDNYQHIFEESNYQKQGEDGDPEGLLGSPIYITEPNKYKVWWSKISPILMFWLWVTFLFTLPSIFEDVDLFSYPGIALLWLAAPFILSIFVILYSGESMPVDVFTNKKIILFRTGLKPSVQAPVKICNWGPYMVWYSYRYAFPNETEMDLKRGNGFISFSNLDAEMIRLSKGPELMAREELMFRMHWAEVEKEAKFMGDKSNDQSMVIY